MTGIIYCYTNKINGKKYIGQTTYTMAARAGSRGQNYGSKFGKAINKYGWDSFVPTVLETVDLDESLIFTKLNELECFYIKHFDSFRNGYNSTPGGDGKGKVVSAETRERIRQIQLSRPPASEETRQKISKAQKGKKKANTENYKKAAARRKGIPPSDETRAKMSAAQKARVNSDSYIHPNAGKHLSDETKLKLSEARKGKEPWNKGATAILPGRSVCCIETGITYISIVAAAEATGTLPQGISQVLRGRAKTTGGYHWEYAD